jgi:hypothetical protein
MLFAAYASFYAVLFGHRFLESFPVKHARYLLSKRQRPP